ncbi:MAG: hypothetical protein H0W12_07500 [Chitinophagaceae bacterium]|nr:hypothetical protein [Chitinophagaceae bacterium]
MGILIGVLFFYYAYKSPVIYTARATLFSLSSNNDMPSASSALSAFLGSEPNKNFSDDASVNIVEVAQSRTTSDAVATTLVPAMGNKPIALLVLEDINDHRGLFEDKKQVPRGKDSLIMKGGVVLRDNVTAIINKNNTLILTYSCRDEELLKVIAYTFIDKIKDFYIDLKREKAKRDYEFATSKVDSLKRVMNSKDYVMIAMDKRTLFTNTNQLQYKVPSENLMADKQLIRNQYSLAVGNQQTAAYKLQKETPVVKVLDRPEPPYEVLRKSKILYGIGGAMLGTFLAGLLLITGLLYNYLKGEITKTIFTEEVSSTTTTTASVL